jgi:probable HAF family extracellular repeat protein
MRLNKSFPTVVALALLSVRMWAGSGSTVSQIDGPGASFTDAAGINNRGEIVGAFQDGQGLHGYVFRRGDFTILDVPVQGALTFALGNNDRGQVVGAYRSQGALHGFVWDRGTFTTDINAPDATETFLHVINNRGQVVGHSRRDVFALARAFLFADGNFTFLNIPGVLVVGRNRESMGLNDRGQVVGTFQSQGVNHGFLYDKGVVTQIDVPGARSTYASGINNRGEIVGSYIDTFDVAHAYLRQPDGKVTQIDAPNAEGIAGVRLNDRSDIVGMFNTAGGRFSGFVWTQSSASTASMPSLMPVPDGLSALE